MSLFRKVALTEFCPSLAIGQEAAAALKAKAQTVCHLLRMTQTYETVIVLKSTHNEIYIKLYIKLYIKFY